MFYLSHSFPNRAVSIAVRPNGKIVVGGNILDSNNGLNTAVVIQLNADGSGDSSFGVNGAAYVSPASGDGNFISRLVVDGDGTIDMAGTNHDYVRNVNRFLFDRMSADGKTIEPAFTYEFGSGNNQDDHALDLAIDSQGRYLVGGYHRGAAGNYDCAVIRIQHSLFEVDPSFGSGGQNIIAFDYGGDNGDFCNALTVIEPSDYVVLGGHATVPNSGGGSHQAAILALLDSSGNLATWRDPNSLGFSPAKFSFDYSSNHVSGTAHAVTRLLLDRYGQFGQIGTLLAIGYGTDTLSPSSQDMGVARFLLPSPFTNFAFDPTFNNLQPELLYLGNASFTCVTNAAAFGNGNLTIAGSVAYTDDTGSTVLSVAARYAKYDGIFNNSFDPFLAL